MKTQLTLNPVFGTLKPSSTLYINEAVNEMWRQGEQVFHMGFGESRFNVFDGLKESLAIHADKKSYLPARGLPELTDAVANYYSVKLEQPFSPKQVLVGPGSKSIIYGLQMVLGADVFLPSPSWVSYAPQAQLLGNKHFYIPSSVENDYKLDLSELDQLVKNSDNPSKLLIINTPNNPTGQMMSSAELTQLAAYCRDNNIVVLSDEIYFEVTQPGQKHQSISKYYPEGSIVCGGLSKHFSIGGWRLGIGLFPQNEFGEALMSKMVTFASETWSGVAAPIQYAALTAYSLEPEVEQYVADCRTIHSIRTKYCHEALSKLGVSCSRAEGAFYIAVNFDQFRPGLNALDIVTSSDLAKHLLDHYRIATLPGLDFGLPEDVMTLRLSTSYLDMEQVNDSQNIFDLFKTGISAAEFMSVTNHPVTNAALEAFEKFISSL
jgi:aspartate/methionine/tyrosine aminotransferase